MADTLTYTGALVVHACWCGIRHSIPAELDRQARDNGKGVYCPLGHRWVFKKTDAEKERERADALERRLSNERAYATSLRDQLGASERTNIALRGWLTRYRKRVANGVCPVEGCKRSFPDVHDHVATKHPGWLEAHPEVFAE